MSKAMRSRMVYRGLIQRLVAGETDPDGHQAYEGWQTLHIDLPIYVWEKNTRESFSTGQTAVVAEIFGMVPLNTDITVRDRINGIRMRNGEIFTDKIYRVEATTRRGLSHLELDLRLVTS